MPAVVSCPCGARVRLPAASEGRAFRCPKCKTELLATLDDKILTSTLAHGGTVGSACPICQAAVKQGEGVVTCPDCDQVHHRECWVDVGGCSTYGCRQAPLAKDKEPGHGGDPLAAVLEACRLRLRPILMTSIAFIMGVWPLVASRGAGAEMRHAMGIAVFAGMIGVTAFGLLLTPVFFTTLRRLGKRARQPAVVATARLAEARAPGGHPDPTPTSG